MLRIRPAAALALALLLAACGDTPVSPGSAPLDPSGDWRLTSFDGLAVPSTYAEFFDEPVGDHIVDHVLIRLDSAAMRLHRAGTFQRQYCFSELHDSQLAFRYCWGDHGVYALEGRALELTSEYIQNLAASGTMPSNDRITLSEPLWHGEDPRATVWQRLR